MDYLPTLAEKCPHSRRNVGSIVPSHGSYGKGPNKAGCCTQLYLRGASTWNCQIKHVPPKDQIWKDSLPTPILGGSKDVGFVRCLSHQIWDILDGCFWRKLMLFVFNVLFLGFLAIKNGMTHTHKSHTHTHLYIICTYITSCFSEKMFEWFSKLA